MKANDWSVLSPPEPGTWQPRTPVSVIIPGYGCHDSLPLVLAALRHQSYPSQLLEVVVVDDGSQPPLTLPPLRPEHSRLVRADDHGRGWGRAHALRAGVAASQGQILHWLDADLVPFPRHVEAQARWHEVTGDAVTLGYKRFVPHAWPDLAEIDRRAAAGTLDQLFPVAETEPHDYIEELIEATDQLRDADHLVFRAHVGATATLRRDLYHEAGGLDSTLPLGEDSEFGYRLAQAGAVFIPEPRAQSWHLGPSHVMTLGERLRRHNWPYLADRMPHPRWLRGPVQRSWTVPLLVAVVVVGDAPLELVRDCVDRLLDGGPPDLRVMLVADWSALTDQRRSVLNDPLLDRRLVAETYRGDPRVNLVDREPGTAFPAPYLLRVPVRLGLPPGTVGALIEAADRWRVGLLRLLPAGADPAPPAAPDLAGTGGPQPSPDPAGTGGPQPSSDLAGTGGSQPSPEPPAVELWRTAAVSRARRRWPELPLAAAVAREWGSRSLTADDQFPLVDLLDPAAADAAGFPTRPSAGRGSTGGAGAGGAGAGGAAAGRGQSPPPVPVAGVRSLLRATGYVGRLAAARVFARRRPPYR